MFWTSSRARGYYGTTTGATTAGTTPRFRSGMKTPRLVAGAFVVASLSQRSRAYFVRAIFMRRSTVRQE
jgi:hypothetical protein